MAGSKRKYILTPRDMALLRSLALLLVIDRAQATQIGSFGSVTRVNTRLLALTRMGLLKRFFVGTSVGTKKSVYCLTRAGAGIAGVPYRRIKITTDQTIGTSLFLEHQLLLNDLYLLTKSSPEFPVTVAAWRYFQEPIAPGSALTPDGYFEFSNGSLDVRPVFVELDLSTETSRVWRRKIDAYLQLATSTEFSRIFGHRHFRVAVITTSDSRLKLIRRVIAERTDKVFFLATLQDIKSAGFWSSIWSRPAGDEKHAFL